MNNHDIVTKISLIAKVVQSGSNRPKWCKKSTMFRPQNSVCLFIGGYPVAHILTVKLKRNSSNCIQFNQEGVKKHLMQHIKKWACRRFVGLVFVVNEIWSRFAKLFVCLCSAHKWIIYRVGHSVQGKEGALEYMNTDMRLLFRQHFPLLLYASTPSVLFTL